MAKIQGEGDKGGAPLQRADDEARQSLDDDELESLAKDEGEESAEAISAARRVGKSHAKAGDQDLRDAETFRALREQEKQ